MLLNRKPYNRLERLPLTSVELQLKQSIKSQSLLNILNIKSLLNILKEKENIIVKPEQFVDHIIFSLIG